MDSMSQVSVPQSNISKASNLSAPSLGGGAYSRLAQAKVQAKQNEMLQKMEAEKARERERMKQIKL